MSQSLRQGMYMLFVLMLGVIVFIADEFNNSFLELNFFQYMMICIFAMIIIKLTDIEDVIREK